MLIKIVYRFIEGALSCVIWLIHLWCSYGLNTFRIFQIHLIHPCSSIHAHLLFHRYFHSKIFVNIHWWPEYPNISDYYFIKLLPSCDFVYDGSRRGILDGLLQNKFSELLKYKSSCDENGDMTTSDEEVAHV